jgi:hypothetical protein
MTKLQKHLTSQFGSLEIDVVKTGEEPGVTREQLGTMLGYADRHRAIAKIHGRNSARLDSLSVVVKMTTTDGKAYDTTIYGFKGVLEICRYSNMPNANAVMDWAWETLDKLRKGEVPTSTVTPVSNTIPPAQSPFHESVRFPMEPLEFLNRIISGNLFRENGQE